MADLVTRLLLNSSQFDNNIRQSTQQVQQFQNTARNITGMIGRFAGALGLAMGAGEAFNRVLNSSQTLGDMTAGNMAALKTTVDEFFYSLGSGNFTSFLSGLGDIITKSKEAYAAIDQLGNTQISFGVYSAKNQSEIADAQYIAKNKFAGVDERNVAFDKWRVALEDQQNNNQVLQNQLIEATSKAVEAKTNANVKVTLDDMLKAFQTDLLSPDARSTVKDRAMRGTNNYLAWSKAHSNDKEGIDRLAQIQKQNLITHTMLEKYSDDELKDIAAKIQQYYQLNSALKSTAREYNETANEYNNSMKSMQGFKPVTSLEGYRVYSADNKPATKVKVEPVIPVGSMAELDKQINTKKTELNLAINQTDRIRINKELEELTGKKHTIEFQYKYPNAPIGKFDTKGAGLSGLAKKTKLPEKIEPLVNKTDVKNLSEYSDGLNAVASMMGAITNLTSEGAAGWLQWSATLLGAVATAIPAIQALTKAKQEEAIGNAVASATQTPVVGWLLAGAAVASVIAAFASMPKFASGGIFTGNSTIGDMNLARVNAGEMILNNRQQKNLFNLLDGNGINGNAGNGEVTFKIQGKELVGVLGNYNNRINKIR